MLTSKLVRKQIRWKIEGRKWTGAEEENYYCDEKLGRCEIQFMRHTRTLKIRSTLYLLTKVVYIFSKLPLWVGVGDSKGDLCNPSSWLDEYTRRTYFLVANGSLMILLLIHLLWFHSFVFISVSNRNDKTQCPFLPLSEDSDLHHLSWSGLSAIKKSSCILLLGGAHVKTNGRIVQKFIHAHIWPLQWLLISFSFQWKKLWALPLLDILVAALYTKVKCNATDVDWTKNIIFLQTNPEKNSKKKGGSWTKTNCYIIDFNLYDTWAPQNILNTTPCKSKKGDLWFTN